ncbi:MAG: AAA family ATPase, partial [Burkholderiaceae bacterium]
MPASQAQTKRRTEVIGIASGKGGVGKTTMSSNLAVALSMMGKQVMLLDADLGLANAQIALGCQTQYNLSHVIAGEKSLKEVIVTSRQGVKLVPGASGVHQMAGLSAAVTAGIVQAFSELDDEIDYLIVDTAAGIAPSVLAFM